METIYSKVEEGVLLAIVVPFQTFNKPRTELVPESEFIQGAAIRVNGGARCRPHKHIWKSFNSQYDINQTKTQECWVVLRGVIRVIFYDIDDTVAKIVELKEGDACFSIHAGHAFECLEDHTCIFEIKTGPYEGQAKDKVFINEKG